MSAGANMKVIDGGLATELSKYGIEINDHPLWSSLLLSTNSSAIQKVHKSYLQSGADIIITASYQASIKGFQKHLKCTVSEAENLIVLSVKLAKETCEEFMKDRKVSGQKHAPLIAGSVGPYAVYLADGSEYTGNYVDNISCEQLMEWHRPRISSLVKAECDLLAFETIPAEKEGIALMKLLKEHPGVKAWLSFCCQDPHLTAHKENISVVVNKCLEIAPPDQLIGIGVNCCPPDYVHSLLTDIDQLPSNTIKIAYPNSGEIWDKKKGWIKTKDYKSLTSYVSEWINAGGQWLGGCCRTGPEDIAAISNIIHSAAQQM